MSTHRPVPITVTGRGRTGPPTLVGWACECGWAPAPPRTWDSSKLPALLDAVQSHAMMASTAAGPAAGYPPPVTALWAHERTDRRTRESDALQALTDAALRLRPSQAALNAALADFDLAAGEVMARITDLARIMGSGPA